MKRILAAYDGTPGAETALKEIIRGGFPERAEARVFSVADVWLPQAEESGPDEAHYAAARQRAKSALDEARATAVKGAQMLHSLFPDWQISSSAAADSPSWAIISEAERWKAGLIIIGSHGRNPLERFFLGSVSHKVAAEARCSVRIVRARGSHSPEGTRIVVGLDGSEDGRRALDEVLTRRWGSRAEVHLVIVADGKLRSSVLGGGLPGSANRVTRLEEWSEPLFREAAGRFAASNLEVHTHLLEGDPKTELLRQAEKVGADCIFLGARGVEHGARLYLGTVASAICARAHCSVEVIRPGA